MCAQIAPTLVRDAAGVERTGNERTEADFLVVAFTCKADGKDAGTMSPTLRAMSPTNLRANGGGQVAVTLSETAVRRLYPVECERLQGFPDNYTAVPYRNKPACDGPRYRSLGNAFAVDVIRWMGERIAMVEAS